MQDKKHGCHNRAPYKSEVKVQDGWQYAEGSMSRTPVMKNIPFTMTTECNYTHTELGRTDKCCAGCKWRAEDSPVQAAA